MSKYKVTSNKSAIKIIRKFWRKVPVSQREFKIFEENLLPGFFRPKLESKHRISYTVPISIPLRAYMEKGVTTHKLYNVLAQIVEMTKKVDMYGFYLNNLVLHDKLIYVKEITGELYFLYEPLEGRDNNTNVYGFLSDMIAKLRPEDREVLEECRQICAFLDEPGNYRISDLEAFIMEFYPQIYQQVPRAEKGMSGFIASSRISYRQHYGTNKGMTKEKITSDFSDGLSHSYDLSRSHGLSYSSGIISSEVDESVGTVLLENEKEAGTVLLQEEGTVLLQQQTLAKLQRLRTGEQIEIRENEFRIGKDARAEYPILDNKAISRRHAVIYCNGSEYSLRDENSTNHTYLNGKLLESGRMESLYDGDKIRFADEEFLFTVE